MSNSLCPTQFAPAERASTEELEKHINYFKGIPLQRRVLDAVPGIVVILNQTRQIVFANLALTAFVESLNESSPLGKRPGEVLHCVHAAENSGGCGTTEFCTTCGAVRAILISQQGTANVQECMISRNSGLNSLELSVSATPMVFQNEAFTIFAVTDISHEKRRRALERIFFHDVLNTAGGLSLYMNLFDKADPQQQDEFKSTIGLLANKLVDEIKAQRDLAAAESNEMRLMPASIDSLLFLHEQCDMYRSLAIEENLIIRIDSQAARVDFKSDPIILGRVLGNMIKNALEASPREKTVTVGCNQLPDEVEFYVQNSTFMPRNVQLQMFQRSFSTKGPNRGLGTYSIKLLGERYLRGKVKFASTQNEGTIFRITLPLELQAERVAL
jgi:K+-sensing histidine kinase KdpD